MSNEQMSDERMSKFPALHYGENDKRINRYLSTLSENDKIMNMQLWEK